MSQSQPNLLFVDDNEDNREILTMIHRYEGYENTAQCEEGDVCIEYLKKHGDELDIMYLDLMMPRVSGFEVMDFINKHFKKRRFYLICQSGKTEPAIVHGAIERGTDLYLEKPFQDFELLTITRAFEKRLYDQRYFEKLEYPKPEEDTLEMIIVKPNELHEAAAKIACYAKDPKAAAYHIFQLIENALIHGNYRINRKLKLQAFANDTYNKFIEEVSQDPKHKDRRVEISIKKKGKKTILTVGDRGEEFPFARFSPFYYEERRVDTFRELRGRSMYEILSYFTDAKHNEKTNSMTVSLA